MSDLSVFKCIKCNDQIKKDEIRIDPNGKDYVCKGCLEQMKKSFVIQNAKQPVINVEKERFVCLSCHYRFSLSKGSRVVPVCGYCSSGKVIKDEADTADKILVDAQKELYDL